MLFAEIAATSAAVTATSSRRRKIELIGACLRKAGPDEAEAAVAYLAGVLRQRQIGVGWASLRELPSPAAEPTLTVADVDATLAAVGAATGVGSRIKRAELLAGLFGRATPDEQHYLRGLLVGEVRQGALAGVAAEAIATAADVPATDVRRALLLRGDLRAVGAAALTGGAAALAEFRLEVGHALAPMLAQPAADIADAFTKVGGEAAVEWKLDGIRVQVHKSGSDVSVYTRSLDDVTRRLPEIVEGVATFPVERFVLDGEAIVLRDDGAPVPFQDTARRTGTRGDTGQLRERLPLTAFFFDVLHVDGADVLDEPARKRWAALERVVPERYLVPRIITDSADEAAEFFADAVARGHEGVVVKSPQAPYDAGRRGAAWLKVKPRHTLDLVVLAVEWGHGRRRGWLSNLHLGARDPENGGFVMLGKTFKGLTDEMLTWQTERLLELAVDCGDWVVRVRPELVVEVAFDGVQASSRYPGGMALRFARVLRYREDKSVTEVDTIDTVRTIHLGSGRR